MSTICTECNEPISHDDYMGKEGQVMNNLDVCFSCAFWMLLMGAPGKAIIDGKMWHPDESINEKPAFGHTRWLGLGGEKNVIEYFNGRVITTYSLWHQGTIPAHFRQYFPDNARFVSRG